MKTFDLLFNTYFVAGAVVPLQYDIVLTELLEDHNHNREIRNLGSDKLNPVVTGYKVLLELTFVRI